MASPSDRRYTDSHEWHKPEGNVVTLGITQFAVNELTDITYAELKPVGTKVSSGDTIGEVESVKATSDIYTAVGGEIVEINNALSNDPSAVNNDPFGKGWLVKIKMENPGQVDSLMDSAAYDEKYPV